MEEKKQNTGQNKFFAFVKKHWILFAVIGLLFLSTFFMRGGSVQVRYVGQETYEYVRLDYSIYGYCINVRPMQKDSKQTARDLSRQVLFMDMDSSVKYVVDKWVYYYGNEETFNFKVKGYTYNTNTRRDELIYMVRDLGYQADAII